MPPSEKEYESLRKKDGHFLYYRKWSLSEPRASLLLLHGMGGYSGRFFELAPFLNEHGFHVEAFDFQGFGVSEEKRGHIPHFSHYEKDILLFLEKMKKESPNRKHFIVAESMGALMTLSLLIHHPDAVNGAVLLSPALKDNLPLSLRERALLAGAAFFTPQRYFPVGFQTSQFTRDERIAAKIERDELEVRNITAKSFYEILKGMTSVNFQANKITTPLLIQQAGIDYLVSAAASEAFYNRLPGPDKFFILYKGFYHALYLDQGRKQVFQDMVHWLEKRTS